MRPALGLDAPHDGHQTLASALARPREHDWLAQMGCRQNLLPYQSILLDNVSDLAESCLRICRYGGLSGIVVVRLVVSAQS